MADAIARSMQEACDRYAKHRELRALSAKLYRALTPVDKRFHKDWQACEFCSDKYAAAKAPWDRIFARVAMPVLPRDMVMYRAVSGPYAAALKRVKVGQTLTIDRYSSFTHSPQMAREFALWQMQNKPIVVICVTLKKGTPFFFASGRDTGGGLSARGRENIDKTQGEVVLAPFKLTKTATKTVKLCDGMYEEKYALSGSVTLLSFSAD
jgi:hypothetical protein